MDFNDTPEEAAFRAEVSAWLKDNVPQNIDYNSLDENAEVKVAKEWQAKKADAGYAQITWPKELGCMGGTPMQQVIYSQEENKYDVPGGHFGIGLGMCIPTLMHYASQETSQRYVKPAIRGEEIWCQLFSEPAAGSDIAGLRTRAEKDGDEWVVNGQKVWTSGAHYSDFGLLLTRTDPNVPKHKGLTMFYLDMKSPGVEVRPIKQASGESNFNEVFFTDVRVPDSQRLGEVGAGWNAALTTLMHERFTAATMSMGLDTEELLRLAKSIEGDSGSALNDKDVRYNIADWYVREKGLSYTGFRTLTALSKGETPGPESSISKVVIASQNQAMASLALDLQEIGGSLMDGEEALMDAFYQKAFLSMPGLRIAGGSDEILRNIIAERVLQLPADVRVDKDISFKELTTGSK